DYLPGLGGAIENVKGTVTLNNVTIADNQATDGGAIRTTNGKSFTSGNSIIADNSSDDCEGTLDSKGYNLILDTSGCTIKGSTSTDVIGEDPILQPLALNAPGTTETQALTAGSPALKAANPAKPNGIDGHCLPTDQRGVTRPKGACDIGAFQLSN
ncbi:MAG TPA: choice-of-anchor Q domain-containing protein, partial [Candidatus Binataceae bacterium]|nr:choice-of-anchor Q domain-containing protein [Candidatus Binataceae bacterium]